MISMDHMGSVADILGPDSCLQGSTESGMEDDRPGSNVTEERDVVDGQAIISFLSAEEMEEYSTREESKSRSRHHQSKTNNLRQARMWAEKTDASGQPTPSESPSLSRSSSRGPDLADETSTTTIIKGEDESNQSGVELSAEDEEPQTPPELDAGGLISEKFAQYAASALWNFEATGSRMVNRLLKKATVTTTSEGTSATTSAIATQPSSRGRLLARKPVSSPLKKKGGAAAPNHLKLLNQVSNAEMDDMVDVSLAMSSDDSLEGFPITEEEYQEVYGDCRPFSFIIVDD